MLISQQDAQRIANEMKSVLPRNINVIDENGIIINGQHRRSADRTVPRRCEKDPV